jgi:hypothetical protein
MTQISQIGNSFSPVSAIDSLFPSASSAVKEENKNPDERSQGLTRLYLSTDDRAR